MEGFKSNAGASVSRGSLYVPVANVEYGLWMVSVKDLVKLVQPCEKNSISPMHLTNKEDERIEIRLVDAGTAVHVQHQIQRQLVPSEPSPRTRKRLQ
ncbi:hypothetical protein AJ79_04676 [Helicocarpus griseus UAMH5409]|uniref:Uncharacterized protein n=1 Tax=Helicocarpus griseus UAMH5409 TaxID=1447875 RepID=A0A2B7XS44_9EURO|nr:hypothetical protein AJ79_04676 [Helicocarpus griseus UAMH5409]